MAKCMATLTTNSHAEIRVKTIKRMIEVKMRGGDIESERFTRAIMTYRNMKHAETKISLVEAVFGREIRAFLPFHRPENASTIAEQAEYWRQMIEQRESALEKISSREDEKWSRQTKKLQQLEGGDN